MLLQPAQDFAVSSRREGFIVHSAEKAWTQKVAQRQYCSYLAVKAANSFMYSPANDWKIPEPGNLVDKNKSMTGQHKEEERSRLEWMQGWGHIKGKPQSRARGQYLLKRPNIVSTAETTLQEGLRPTGYTALSKEAMMAAAAKRNGRVLDVMRSSAAGPEPMLRPTEADMELRYCSTSWVQEPLGLVHPSRKWSRSRSWKEQPVVKSRWVVLIVTELESDGALYVRACG